jgi:uncharacterized protein with FMN-binding domain
MRRALIATAGTVAALVAILEYKSTGTDKLVPVAASSTPSTPGHAKTPATYTGRTIDYRYGDIEVAVTLEAGKITAVNVPVNDAVDGRSEAINSESVPILVREVLAAQGVNIDVVSGATYTSDAFAQSLQAALAKAPK